MPNVDRYGVHGLRLLAADRPEYAPLWDDTPLQSPVLVRCGVKIRSPIVDRLTVNGQIIETETTSYRLAQARAKRSPTAERRAQG